MKTFSTSRRHSFFRVRFLLIALCTPFSVNPVHEYCFCIDDRLFYKCLLILLKRLLNLFKACLFRILTCYLKLVHCFAFTFFNPFLSPIFLTSITLAVSTIAIVKYLFIRVHKQEIKKRRSQTIRNIQTSCYYLSYLVIMKIFTLLRAIDVVYQ